MKKIFGVLLSTVAATMLFSGETPDSTPAKDAAGAAAPEPIFVENFDNGAAKWSLPDGFSVVPNEGCDGTGALVYHRQTPEHYKFAYVVLGKLDPQKKYRLTIMFRTELKEDPARGVVEVFDILSYKRNGKERELLSRIIRPISTMNAPEWQQISKTFSVPADSDVTVLRLMIHPKRIGKQWYDNIRIEPVAE